MAKADAPAAADQDQDQTESYVVAHGNVGEYFQGEVVTRAHFPAGTNFDRLFALKALHRVNSHDGDEVLAQFSPAETTPLSTIPGEPAPVRLPEADAAPPVTAK